MAATTPQQDALLALAADCGSLAELKRTLLRRVARAAVRRYGNRLRAAAALGVHRNTMTRLLQKGSR